MTGGSMCSGGGGLDMAVQLLFPDIRWAWHCESDPHASAVLEARWPDVPNLGDIKATDWTTVAPVDLVVAGFPCQDISGAGKQAGITRETRSGLWFWIADALRVLRPRWILLENVARITTLAGALDVVLGELAEGGFDAEWGCLRASDVGAPHGRDRWFCVAYPHGEGLEGRHSGSLRERGRQRAVGTGGAPSDVSLLPTPRATRGGSHTETQSLLPTPNAGGFNEGEDLESFRARQERMRERHGNGNGMGTPLGVAVQVLPTPRSSDGPKGGPGQTGDGLQPAVRALPTPRSNADRTSRGALTRDEHWSAPSLSQAVELATGILPREYDTWDEVQGNQPTEWGDYAPAIARWEQILGRPAPAPTDSKGRLSPTFVEWMMGWPGGWTDVGLSRAQRLKVLGNGVVPHQAYAAYSGLLERQVVAA